MPLIKAGDINLEHYTDGSAQTGGRSPGPPLLMIRGFTGRAQSWGKAFLDDLARDFTTIRYSHTGIGQSEPSANVSIKSMADDGVNLLTALGIEKAHVFGISMGGMVAQELALHHPDRVLTLTLGCTHCGGSRGPAASPEAIKALTDTRGTQEERSRRAWAYSMGPGWEQKPDAVSAVENELAHVLQYPTPLSVVGQQWAAIQQFDTYDRLPSLNVPTQIIHGDHDQIVLVEHGRIIHERMPGSWLHILPGAGHVFMNDQPDETAHLLREHAASAVPATA